MRLRVFLVLMFFSIFVLQIANVKAALDYKVQLFRGTLGNGTLDLVVEALNQAKDDYVYNATFRISHSIHYSELHVNFLNVSLFGIRPPRIILEDYDIDWTELVTRNVSETAHWGSPTIWILINFTASGVSYEDSILLYLSTVEKTYDDLVQEEQEWVNRYWSLNSSYVSLSNELSFSRCMMYTFIITTAAFGISTFYFARRKSKPIPLIK
jgi:hypothetical protein